MLQHYFVFLEYFVQKQTINLENIMVILELHFNTIYYHFVVFFLLDPEYNYLQTTSWDLLYQIAILTFFFHFNRCQLNCFCFNWTILLIWNILNFFFRFVDISYLSMFFWPSSFQLDISTIDVSTVSRHICYNLIYKIWNMRLGWRYKKIICKSFHDNKQ